MGAIFRRELKAYFTSPIAYIYIAAFYLYIGNYFVNYNMAYGSTDMTYVFSNAFVIMMILLPLLTMRLFTEEKKYRTDQCLLTAPVSLGGIVFGKFLAATCVFLCGMLIYIPFIIVLYGYAGTLEWATIIGTMLALVLLGASFVSIGVFVSSLTESQVVAAIFSFGIIMFFYMIDILASSVSNETVSSIMSALGFYSRYSEFSTGIFDVGSILFFASTIFVFNFLTVRVLEKRRWAD
ncbi:MAG: ABC transporter permease subunit [Oscillospiraceae bacterium]|nr:ABC transporter permease subunit [Oscillospiraceae bacterium]